MNLANCWVCNYNAYSYFQWKSQQIMITWILRKFCSTCDKHQLQIVIQSGSVEVTKIMPGKWYLNLICFESRNPSCNYNPCNWNRITCITLLMSYELHLAKGDNNRPKASIDLTNAWFHEFLTWLWKLRINIPNKIIRKL